MDAAARPCVIHLARVDARASRCTRPHTHSQEETLVKPWRMFVCLSVLVAPVRSATATATDEAAMLEAWKSITGDGIARHIQVLASDEYEGREPGTAGEEKAVKYMEQAFRDAGAGPGFNGAYLQPVPLIELKRDATPTFSVSGAKKNPSMELKTDYVVSAGAPREKASLAGLPIVFVGHGVNAPEFDWNDYADVDLKGCCIMLLRGDPEVPGDTVAFRGNALTVHGLTSTQGELAARLGAKAAIVVHTQASTGVPWNLIAGGGGGSTQNFLPDEKERARLDVLVNISEPAAKRLLASAGLDLDSLTARANRRGFRAVRTPLTASMSYGA